MDGEPDGDEDEASGEEGGAPGEADLADAAEAEQAELAREREAVRAKQGPLDESEAGPETGMVDLGALRLPARQDVELRLEVQDKTRVMSVTVAMAGSSLQLQAFAAPRTAGVWDDIREEIAVQVTKQGGTAEEADGVFGPELLARIPSRTADGRTGHRTNRFVGVDGPRWFLRGVFTGPAAHDPAAAGPLEELMRSCVVVRGTDAKPPRELLALKLPPTATPAPPPAASTATATATATAATATAAAASAAAPAPAAPHEPPASPPDPPGGEPATNR